MRKNMAVGALIAPKPLEIQKHLIYEKIIEIWQRTYTTTKKLSLLLCFMSNIGFCQKIDNSQFVVLAKLTKSAQIAKIRSLLLTKLFTDQVWKWPYFCNSVKFWCWKWYLKIANFGPPRELEISTKWSGTKPQGVILDISISVSISLRI